MSRFTTQQQQIKLLNQLYRLQDQTLPKKKTIILYDQLKNLNEEANALTNLHICAKAILVKSLEVTVKREVIDDCFQDVYTVSPNQMSQVKIIERVFEVQGSNQNNNCVLHNIFTYQLEEGDSRVVVIPIQNDLIDISGIRRETQKDEKEHDQFIKELRDSGKQGDDLKKAHDDWNKQRNERFVNRCKVATQKHLKMFKIEAFLATILEKTQTVSICSLVEIGQRRFKQLGGFQQEFNNLFSVPTSFTPQYVLHGWAQGKTKVKEAAQKEEVTTIFTSQKGKFGNIKFEVWNERYFFPKDKIRTKIYEVMQTNSNIAIIQVIKQFMETWNKITLEAAQSFATVLRFVNSTMTLQKSNEDLNATFNASFDSKDSPPTLSIQEIFEKYIHPSLYLPSKVILENYYTPKRLGEIRPEKGEQQIIPSTIQNLAFSHFLYKMINQFLQNYHQKELETNNDQIQLLSTWKDFLKPIYQLVKATNNTFLSQSLSFQSSDIQKFFNFLTFAFRSMEKIQSITKRDLVTASSLKSFFEQLKPKKNKLLSYIVSTQKDILQDQPISYYDIYLLIIHQNTNKDIQSDIEYIYLHIHQLKAYCIAKRYIQNKEKLIQAIRSYALIGQKYTGLSESKKKLIKIFQIQSRLARLLRIVGQYELAAQIYMKNRETEFADNCYKKIEKTMFGDTKAENNIKWGKRFENEFQYGLAFQYYRKAFSCTKTVSLKQTADKCKMDLIKKIGTTPNDNEVRKHQSFAKEGDLVNFTNHIDLNPTFKKARIALQWNSQAHSSTIRQGTDFENEDIEKSFFANFQGKLNTQSSSPQ